MLSPPFQRWYTLPQLSFTRCTVFDDDFRFVLAFSTLCFSQSTNSRSTSDPNFKIVFNHRTAQSLYLLDVMRKAEINLQDRYMEVTCV
jgi:hypothetical protein